MKKLKGQRGFTLVEMLIVVAIIAVLIMVSIPMIGANLEKARVGVDEANERSAQGMAMAYYSTLTKTNKDILIGTGNGKIELYYYIDPESHQGQISPKGMPFPDSLKYGLSKEPRGDNNVSPKGKCIEIKLTGDGKLDELNWVDSSVVTG